MKLRPEYTVIDSSAWHKEYRQRHALRRQSRTVSKHSLVTQQKVVAKNRISLQEWGLDEEVLKEIQNQTEVALSMIVVYDPRTLR